MWSVTSVINNYVHKMPNSQPVVAVTTDLMLMETRSLLVIVTDLDAYLVFFQKTQYALLKSNV